MRFFSGFGLKEEKELFDDILYNSDFLVAGFSKGAIDAFEYIKRSKERVDRLILISPAFFQTKDEKFKRVQLMSYKKNPKKYLDSFYKNITYPADFDIIKYKKEDSFDELKRLLYYTWDNDSLESLKKRGVVLEVFLGAEDKIIDSVSAREFFKRFAKVYFIKNVGHLLRR